MISLVFLVTSIVLVAVSQLMLKQGVVVRERKGAAAGGMLKMLFEPWVFGGLALNGVAAGFWLIAISRLELSYAFPFLSLNYILIPLGASYFFKENISRYRMIGIGVICLGVIMIAFS
ncbi:MAG: EamA family transporter [Bacteroidia bacterium]|nr:EamA family transporter [Bacteroidia bacterium]